MRKFHIDKLQKDTFLIGTISVVIGVTLLGGTIAYRKSQSNTNEEKTTQQNPPVTPSPTTTPSVAVDINKITDSEFSTYSNSTLGLTMKLPKTAVNQYGGCQFIGAYDSYTSQYAKSPLLVFEDVKNSSLYIAFDHYYQLSGKTNESGAMSYSDCKLVKNSADTIASALKNDPDFSGSLWEISYQKVQNENELEKFIQSEHGDACIIKEQIELSPGVFDVRIVNSAPQSNTCMLNYNYILQYNANKKVAVSWNLGQTDTVFRDYDPDYEIFQAYDEYIIKSFQLK